MKKTLSLIFFALCTLRGLDAVELKLSVDKQSYLPEEPIWISLVIKNETSKHIDYQCPLTGYFRYNLRERNRGIIQWNGIHISMIVDSRYFYRIPPGDSLLRGDECINYLWGGFGGIGVGDYQLQIVLPPAILGNKNEITSNTIAFTIVPPCNKNDSDVIAAIGRIEDTAFIEKYSRSFYAPVALSRIADRADISLNDTGGIKRTYVRLFNDYPNDRYAKETWNQLMSRVEESSDHTLIRLYMESMASIDSNTILGENIRQALLRKQKDGKMFGKAYFQIINGEYRKKSWWRIFLGIY